MMRRNPQRTRAILRYYRSGHTLRETARCFGLTYQRVHQVVHKYAPKEMRPPYITNRRRA
jgi:helix-turn-helix protein